MPLVLPSTYHDPATGTVAPATWGDGVNAAIAYLGGGFPHASILESTPQSVANATETDLTSNEENSDIGGLHSTVTSTERLTVPTGEGGLYRVLATVKFDFDVDGYRVLSFRKNNTTNYDCVVQPPVTVASVQSVYSGSRSLLLAAGDYITCRVFHTAGAALNVTMVDFSMEFRATA